MSLSSMALGAVLPDGFVDLFHGGFDEGDAVEKDGWWPTRQ
jgi:hypothetical protein